MPPGAERVSIAVVLDHPVVGDRNDIPGRSEVLLEEQFAVVAIRENPADRLPQSAAALDDPHRVAAGAELSLHDGWAERLQRVVHLLQQAGPAAQDGSP